MNFVPKTYADSFLYNQQVDTNNKNLVDFVLKAERIDKKDPAFAGIIEEVKRTQRTSVLYSILLRDDIVLCARDPELPRAFKVFEAKDLREDNKKKIFIDVTKIIVRKDNYFYCNNIGFFITYLLNALVYLLYNKEPGKILNSSNISIAGAECYTAMSNYIIDYLRIIGFAANKPKISYLTALFFLNNMMGKEIDSYTKNIAAKIAGLSSSEIRPFDLYYKEEDFKNIHTFISMIATNFKLKDFNSEVFVNKWMYLFGTGTYYGTELFTSFACLITSAYSGSYVVNQKQVERCCGTSMVKFTNEIIKLGTDCFDRRGYIANESDFENTMKYVDKSTKALQEALFNRKKIPENCKFDKNDYASKSKCKEKINNLIKHYRVTEQENKLSPKLKDIIYGAMRAQGKYNTKGESDVYESGTIEVLLKASKPYLSTNDKRIIDNEIKASIDSLPEIIRNNIADKEKSKRFSKALIELRKCSGIL